MNDEQLEQLLSDADAAAGVPPVPDELARHLIQRARKRRTARRLGTILSLVVISGTSVWLARGKSASRQVTVNSFMPSAGMTEQSSQETLKATLARLEFEADLHGRIARDLARSRRNIGSQSDKTLLAASNLAATLAESREQSAYIMVAQGDHLLDQPNGRPAAINAYRRVLQLFPKSSEASTARQRLERVGA